VNDWRSYDAIAETYARVWAPRFEAIARHLLALARPAAGARLLDLGAGSGAVAVALGDDLGTMRQAVGCDLSLPMLLRARHRVQGLRLLRADAVRLPFRDASFDLATANCVLSHLRDYGRALAEASRVLARPGGFAMSSWGPSSDPYAAAWRELLDGAVAAGTTQRSVDEVAPSEGYFSSPDNVRAALLDAGFGSVRVEVMRLSYDYSVEDFLGDRELSAGGRFGRHVLGEARWRRFLEGVGAELRRRFAGRIRYDRPLVLAVGTLG